ncbi:hypothetical protein FOMPIDRAFT_1048449 [Fomitopsis schrenkii]|uniref:Fungal-type protein kinase domain-containing protein n=1 Tax=Fomitopsis schrenkii TaxID=2126942 RepID=S8EA44_FOMSC|nr:hypothetical protein FOMPIDRAFT_1048449 [Fomitopsis schrenkii]
MLHRDISEGNVMTSRDPDVPYQGFVHDFDYSLNWQKFLVRLGLVKNLTWEDWDKFVSAECLKLAEKNQQALQAQWRKEKEETVARLAEAARLEEASRRAQQAGDGQDSDDDTQATADIDPSVPSDTEGYQEEASQLSSEDVAQSLGTEDDYCEEDSQKEVSELSRADVAPSYGADNDNNDNNDANEAELDEVEGLVGVKLPLAASPKDSPPSEEEIKRQCKLRTGTLYFKAIDLLSPGDVVHEVRHDLESFFWLLIWILLRYTIHILGRGSCAELFNHDSERSCRRAKIAFLSEPGKLRYYENEPLTQLVREFAVACKTNYRIEDAEPSDPLTHKIVLDIFDEALALASWPATGDHAIPYDVLEVNKPPRQRGSRPDSNLDSSRISSGSLLGVEPSNVLLSRQRDINEALPGGSMTSRGLANALAEGGSRSRKRSREAPETTEAQSDEERSKRTKTNSKCHEDAAQSVWKGSRVRGRNEVLLPRRRSPYGAAKRRES